MPLEGLRGINIARNLRPMEMQLNPCQITNWQLSAVEQLRMPLQLMPPLPPLTALQETAVGRPEVSFPGEIRFQAVAATE